MPWDLSAGTLFQQNGHDFCGLLVFEFAGIRLKILFVSDVSMRDVIGGAERVLFEQTTAMSQRGHGVHVLTRRLTNHGTAHECIYGVDEWRYDCHQCNPAAFLITTGLNAKRLFESLQKKYHFDCINFHQPFSALGVNFSELSRALPKVYTCHSLSFEEYLSRDRAGTGIFRRATRFFQLQARAKIEKYSLTKSNAIVVLSRFTKDKLVDAYKIRSEKIETIPGGVDLEKFHPAADRAAIRKQLQIPPDKVTLFTVRNLVPRMGLENLIFACSDLIKQRAAIHVVIGGDGALKDDLAALAKSKGVAEHIQFAGFIPEELLPRYYQMADLFVLPTKTLEGFGLVTLEAMASGVPVLGTPVGGIAEILAKFDSNFLFKGTDPKSMAELIIEYYRLIRHHPQRWKEISHRCRKFVENNYSWKKNIDAFEELLVGMSHTR